MGMLINESCRCKEPLRYQNGIRYRTPARAQAGSRHRFQCIDILSLDRFFELIENSLMHKSKAVMRGEENDKVDRKCEAYV